METDAGRTEDGERKTNPMSDIPFIKRIPVIKS